MLAGDLVSFVCGHCSAPSSVMILKAVPGSSPGLCEPDRQAASPGDENRASSQAPLGQTCPKCTKLVDHSSAACGSCGLAAEHFASFEADKGHCDVQLDEAWQRLLQSWQSDEAHEAFVRMLASAGNYRDGATRYREAAADAERAVRPQEMLQRIQATAAAALLSSKPKLVSEEEPFKGVVVLLMVLVLAAGAGGIYFTMIGGQQHQRRGERDPREQPSESLNSSGSDGAGSRSSVRNSAGLKSSAPDAGAGDARAQRPLAETE